MNKLSPKHKDILNSLATIYATEKSYPYYSKRKLREILIHFKWNKEDAIRCIEKGQCYYWWTND